MLGLTALAVGVLHTLLGPDHYLPFIALARSRGWTRSHTLAVTLTCGLGHLAGSIVLGALALALGWGLTDLAWWEQARGALAGWLLVGFGVAYLAWGIRRALRQRPHSHPHVHSDGTIHSHEHGHLGSHAHPHGATGTVAARHVLAGTTAWALFVVFVLGPCEPLIPILMYPAAGGNTPGVALVVALFATGTLGTMAAVVLAASRGLARIPSGSWERWSHAAAGLAIVACGLAIQLGL
jgi:ABC-type nickel/cobalt efflux system permease component RcnA